MSTREPVTGEPGYIPNEMDFCACGATFQPDPKAQGKAARAKARRNRCCPRCGAPEGKPHSFHERTGLPYQNLLLPCHRSAPE